MKAIVDDFSTWLKAKILLLAVALLWGSMLLLSATVQIPLSLLSAKLKNQALKDLCYSYWMIQDHFCGVILSGHHETTVSAMIGHYYKQGSKTAAGMRVVVDWLFKVIFGQLNHCVGAIEKHDTFRFNGWFATAGFFAYWFNLYCVITYIQRVSL